LGMQLPSELISLLGVLGYEWPESDEEKIFSLAGEWTGMADQISGRIEALNSAAKTLLDNNTGAQIDAFKAEWDGPESAVLHLADTTDPNYEINIGLTVIAGLVLALKIQVIVQLAILACQIAYAIATAPLTFGASLVQIPIFKTITGLILDQLIGMATEKVLNG
jgi:hypothetical protein